MRVYSLADAPLSLGDAVFKESWRHKIVGLITLVGLASLPIFVGPSQMGWVFFALWEGFLLLFVFFFAWTFRRLFGPHNWLLRVRPDGVLINLRSYLNAHFDPHDPVVVHLSPRELQRVSTTRQTLLTATDKGVQKTTTHYLDLHLRTDDGHAHHASDTATKIEQFLRDESSPQRSSFRANSSSVRIVDGPVVRLVWSSNTSRVTPPLRDALRALTVFAPEGPERVEHLDYVTPAETRKQNEDRILDLAARGEIIAATKLTRRCFGYSTAEARAFVESLTSPPPRP